MSTQYERSYGYLYRELGERPTTADIAKAIRADIKTAQAEGLLPARWAYSVRSDSFSGGSSIDVRVQDCADAWQPCDGSVPGTRRTFPDGSSVATGCPNHWCAARNDSPHATAHDVLTEEARSAEITLERIHGAYNHDGSDVQSDYFDVRYYGTVGFESASSAEFRAAEKARVEARKLARAEMPPIGLYVHYPRSGSRVVHVIVAAEDRKVLACGARVGRMRGSLAELGSLEVTCSRCAKHSSPA